MPENQGEQHSYIDDKGVIKEFIVDAPISGLENSHKTVLLLQEMVYGKIGQGGVEQVDGNKSEGG